MGEIRIIAVCTANICRSPSTAALLRSGLAELLPTAVVSSAGVAAQPDHPVCDLSAALTIARADDERSAARTAADLAEHRSQLLTAEDLVAADLVLGLERSHRSAIARLHPAGRPRTFTLRQAAAAAERISGSLAAGALPEGAPPVPSDPADRFRWWVAELDAARALLPGGRQHSVGALAFDEHDIPDPHVVGYQFHPMTAEAIGSAVELLLDSVRLLLPAGDADSPTLAERHEEAR